MHHMQQNLVTEPIEEYAVGALDRAGLERHIVGMPPRGSDGQMKALGKPFSYTIYPGAQHAFNDNGNPERYHPTRARIAWNDMLEFLAQHLAGGASDRGR